MKKMFGVIGLLGMIASIGYAKESGRYVTISCDLSGRAPRDVVRTELTAVQEVKGGTIAAPLKPGLKLFLVDGSQKFLEPVAKADEFGKPLYTKEIPFENGKLFFPGSEFGDIYLNFECYYSPDIPSPQRCQSQGSHRYYEYSRVDLNLGGTVLNFVGKNICTRAVVEF